MSKPLYNLKPGRSLGKNYQIVEFLGHGWEGEVYKVEERSTKIIRAAKLFYKHRYQKKNVPPVLYAKKLYQLRSCPIVIQYHYQDSLKIQGENIDFLVSDFADGVLLSQYIDQKPGKRLLPFEALHLFYALVLGVEQIHYLGEYHGDIHTANIIIKPHGLSYDVHLIDLMHLGRATKYKIQTDIFHLITVLYELIGGDPYYAKMPPQIKKIILGRKLSLIEKQFNTAGHLRLYLENMEW